MAVRAAESSVILQDGSPEALDVLQHFLASPHHLSIQLGNMLSLLQERGDFPNFRRGLNEEKSIVVMVFSDVDVVRKFIEAKDVLWIPCPLLLLSLTPGEDSRYAFVFLISFRIIKFICLFPESIFDMQRNTTQPRETLICKMLITLDIHTGTNWVHFDAKC